jgi:hypothetical protein
MAAREQFVCEVVEELADWDDLEVKTGVIFIYKTVLFVSEILYMKTKTFNTAVQIKPFIYTTTPFPHLNTAPPLRNHPYHPVPISSTPPYYSRPSTILQ